MSKSVYFVAGTALGVYLDQIYSLPSIREFVSKAIRYLKENEKK